MLVNDYPIIKGGDDLSYLECSHSTVQTPSEVKRLLKFPNPRCWVGKKEKQNRASSWG